MSADDVHDMDEYDRIIGDAEASYGARPSRA
jgi:hypothetical protein